LRSFAQQQQQPQQQPQQERTTGFNERPAPIHRSFNSCVELAMQRGWSQSDIYEDGRQRPLGRAMRGHDESNNQRFSAKQQDDAAHVCIERPVGLLAHNQ